MSCPKHDGIHVKYNWYYCLINKIDITKWMLKKFLNPNTFLTIRTDKGYVNALIRNPKATIEYDLLIKWIAYFFPANYTKFLDSMAIVFLVMSRIIGWNTLNISVILIIYFYNVLFFTQILLTKALHCICVFIDVYDLVIIIMILFELVSIIIKAKVFTEILLKLTMLLK